MINQVKFAGKNGVKKLELVRFKSGGYFGTYFEVIRGVVFTHI